MYNNVQQAQVSLSTFKALVHTFIIIINVIIKHLEVQLR